MTQPRRDMVGDERECSVFHCMVRCVRRAFLCGDDPYTGRNYDHRLEWIRDRLSLLSRSFGVEVLTYAVMSNHVHTVLRRRPDCVEAWSDHEAARRWLAVYTPRHTDENGERVYEVRERDIQSLIDDAERLATIRKRLSDLSWFMKSLNESISRRSNKEDNLTGRFWESRFKCQRLEDEAAVLTCMSYVDLNPVRANIAEGLEDSEFTGVYDRIEAGKVSARLNKLKSEAMSRQEHDKSEENLQNAIARRNALVDLNGKETPFSYLDERGYLNLLDWAGRRIRTGKSGYIRSEVRAILENSDLDADEWIRSVKRYNTLFGSIAGRVDQLRKVAEETGRRWLKGTRKAEAMFRLPDKIHQRA